MNRIKLEACACFTWSLFGCSYVLPSMKMGLVLFQEWMSAWILISKQSKWRWRTENPYSWRRWVFEGTTSATSFCQTVCRWILCWWMLSQKSSPRREKQVSLWFPCLFALPLGSLNLKTISVCIGQLVLSHSFKGLILTFLALPCPPSWPL